MTATVAVRTTDWVAQCCVVSTASVTKTRRYFGGWSIYLSTPSSPHSSQDIHEWQEKDPEHPQCVKYNPIELSYLHEVLH